MKKISILAMILAILLTLSTVAMAEENTLTLSDVSVREDETIYLTLRLNKSVIGDAMGISYSFDSAVLEPLLSSCAWSQKGALSNFNKEHAGVWAANSAKDLSGDICVLAFKIKDGVKLTETTVSCTLIIKNGAVEQGTFTAQAKITYACNHSYGDWETGNESGHIKTCVHCGEAAFQPHSWNSPETEKNAEDPEHDWLVYTCQTCGFIQRVEIPKQEDPKATEPVTEPTAAVTVPSLPTMPPETHPIPTAPPTSEPETAPTASNSGDVGGKEPVMQTNPTLPPQETLPRDPETRPAQETRPSSTENSKDNTPAPSENDAPTEKEEEADSGSQSPRPSEDPKDPPRNTEGATTGQSKDNEEEPTTRATYPDNSSNAIAQTTPTKETDAPETTAAPTSPYNDYNPQPSQTTGPYVMPVQTQAPSDTHDHDHGSVTEPPVAEEEGNPVVNALMTAAVLIAAVGGATLYLKKKRK